MWSHGFGGGLFDPHHEGRKKNNKNKTTPKTPMNHKETISVMFIIPGFLEYKNVILFLFMVDHCSRHLFSGEQKERESNAKGIAQRGETTDAGSLYHCFKTSSMVVVSTPI